MTSPFVRPRPSSRMYLFRCATCETIRVVEGLADAQAAFNDHAAEQHETVLKRIEEPAETGTAPPKGEASASQTEHLEPDRERSDSR